MKLRVLKMTSISGILLDTTGPHIKPVLALAFLTIDFAIKASCFVPLCPLLFPQPLVLPLQQGAVGPIIIMLSEWLALVHKSQRDLSLSRNLHEDFSPFTFYTFVGVGSRTLFLRLTFINQRLHHYTNAGLPPEFVIFNIHIVLLITENEG